MTDYNTKDDAIVARAQKLSERDGIPLRKAISYVMGVKDERSNKKSKNKNQDR